jgi:hypothetical protein
VPVSVALWTLPSGDGIGGFDVATPTIGFLCVMLGGQIAGTLAWTAASLEEGGDLLLSSPSDGKLLFWSKALATALPSAAFLIVMMAGVALRNPTAALLGLLIGGFGLACCGAIEFLRPRPARRVKMTQRPDRSTISVGLGALFSMIWGSATAVAMAGLGFWTLIPIAIGLGALVFVWVTSPRSVVWLAKAQPVGAPGGPWKA